MVFSLFNLVNESRQGKGREGRGRAGQSRAGGQGQGQGRAKKGKGSSGAQGAQRFQAQRSFSLRPDGLMAVERRAGVLGRSAPSRSRGLSAAHPGRPKPWL